MQDAGCRVQDAGCRVRTAVALAAVGGVLHAGAALRGADQLVQLLFVHPVHRRRRIPSAWRFIIRVYSSISEFHFQTLKGYP